jgi:hypothetical protein
VSLARLWLFLAVALPVLAALLAPMSSVDLTYHLRAGGEILATRSVPAVDAWTFTAAGQPWVDQQWGAQVVLALAERLGGWTGLALLRAVLTGIIFASLIAIGRRHGLAPRNAALLTLAAFLVAAPALALRPQLFGMACFAVVLWLVDARQRYPRGLWLVPAIVLVWANLHGSFFLGPAVLGLAWLQDRHDRVTFSNRTFLVALLSAAAGCLTPFGPAVWVYAVGLSVNPEVTARITEWQPTSVRDLPGILFFASALGAAALLARRAAPVAWPTLAWLGFFFVIGVYAQRGVAWWPLGAFVPVAGLLAGSAAVVERSDPAPIRRLNLVIVAALTIAAVALLPAWRPTVAGSGTPLGTVSQAPAGITAALRDLALPDDRLFAPQPWGSWFEYALPALPVAIDSRIEFFPPSVWAQYEAVVSGVDGWQAQLADWRVSIVVVRGDGGAFANRLEAAGWVEVYRDGDGRILLRAGRQLAVRGL